jgi:hypothetical protein
MTNQMCYDLPRVERIDLFDPEPGEVMEFRLTYKGTLPSEGSGGSRTKEKHQLRKHFHKQLRELWQQHPDLRQQAEQYFIVQEVAYIESKPKRILPTYPGTAGAKTWLEHIADDHQRCGGRFVPLVSKRGGFTCSLEILFLRRDNPGHLISSGGDIDNRLKVLFDGLKMPSTVGELGGFAIDSDENPFYCLLEDDSLITSVSVITDRLLNPQLPEEKVHDVDLVIRVTVVNPSAVFAGNRLV